MADSSIIFGGRQMGIHRSTLNARIGDPTVLTSDFWMYVDLWLRRKQQRIASFYWQQAKSFFEASSGLAATSAPLPLYYCFLNASKALLELRGIRCGPYHGLSGKSTTKKATLSGETVTFRRRGVMPALSTLMGDSDTRVEYSLKQVLYNIPFIHRAFTLTFEKQPELLVPLSSAYYTQKDGSSEAWVFLSTDWRGDPAILLGALPPGYEQDMGWADYGLVIRKKQRFRWRDNPADMAANLQRLSTYNSKVRNDVVYIRGQPPSWYLKLRLRSPDVILRSTLTLTIAAMHRLSELARYNPLRLKLLMYSQHNWLISEFVDNAVLQFLDEIACEITGQNLAYPFVRLST